MKHLFLTAVGLLSAMATLQAAEKTVTLNLSDPTAYGYEMPGADGTPLEVGNTIVQDEVTITVTSVGSTPVRFYQNANTGVITLRLASGCAISVEASGNTITGITATGSNIAANNVTAEPGEWAEGAWTGEATTVSLTRAEKTVQFETMAVTFNVEEAQDPEPEPQPENVETYSAITGEFVTDADGNVKYQTTLAPEFAEAIAVDGSSEIIIGTEHMDLVAVGGSTPKDVTETETGVFPGWAEWNDVKWDAKSQNLDDNKTRYFNYVAGTGNPCVEIGHEAVTTDGYPTGVWRATYVFYGPEDAEIGGKVYRNQMPIQGLYYKFTPKTNGELTLAVWSNKGKRNTYVVDEETAAPVEYTATGYINGQNETLEDGTNAKRLLTADEIQALHDAACVVDGVDNNPYVIGAGNQPFWGYLTIAVEAGKSYWLFQDSSQIGFSGYTFQYDTTTAIQEVRKVRDNGVTYDLFGHKANGAAQGRIMIQNGRKVMFR